MVCGSKRKRGVLVHSSGLRFYFLEHSVLWMGCARYTVIGMWVGQILVVVDLSCTMLV